MILPYNPNNKANARKLRANMTDAERILWSHVRRKQILGVQFYRQKPLANFIVDFYAAKIHLVIEIDGGQHFDKKHQQDDNKRDVILNGLGLKVLRFDNHQVMTQTDEVVHHICRVVESLLEG